MGEQPIHLLCLVVSAGIHSDVPVFDFNRVTEMIYASLPRERMQMMLCIFLFFAKKISEVRLTFLLLLTPSFVPSPP